MVAFIGQVQVIPEDTEGNWWGPDMSASQHRASKGWDVDQEK